MPRHLVSNLVALTLLLALSIVLLGPIAAVVRGGFLDDGSWSLAWFSDLFGRPAQLRILLNSLLLAIAATGLCLVIAIPLALLANSFEFAGKRAWLALIQIPMILPPFVGALGLKSMLSRNGGINALLADSGLIDPTNSIEWLRYPFWSCVVLEALYLYPILFLNIQAALANIDPALDEAARNLGAGPVRRFFRITLPLMRPGVFAGATIVFIWVFTELGTPLLVGYRDVAAVQIFDLLSRTNPEGDAYAMVIVLLVVSVLLYLVGKMLLGRPPGAMLAKASVVSQPRRLRTGGALLVTVPFALVFLLAVLPHIGVVLSSLSSTGMLEWAPERLTLRYHAELIRDLFAFFGQPGRGLAALSVINSLKYASIATALSLVIGFGIAYLAVRRRNWISSTVDGLAMLPLAVPGLVLAFGFFVVTQGDSPLAFLNPLKAGVDPTPLLVTAYTVRRLPFIVRSCAAGLEQTSVALEEAAANLGANWFRMAVAVVIPLLAANFIAGGLLVFSRSMLEVSDSLILAFDKDTYPMTKAIYDLSDQPAAGIQKACALGVWGMVLLTVTIAGASLALGKRLGALFRV